jgi:hypothetical protein
MFNFHTLADALKAQADNVKLMAAMGWDKVKKPGADRGPEEVKPPAGNLVESGVIVVKPRKAAKPRKVK